MNILLEVNFNFLHSRIKIFPCKAGCKPLIAANTEPQHHWIISSQLPALIPNMFLLRPLKNDLYSGSANIL